MKINMLHLKKYLMLLANIVLLLGLIFSNPVWAACNYDIGDHKFICSFNGNSHSTQAACDSGCVATPVISQPVNVPVYTYTVKAQIAGGEGGCIREVASSDCKSSHIYEKVEQDTPFMFQVSLNEGYTFSEWSGDCKGRSAGLATMTTTTYEVEEFGEKVFICTAVLEKKKTPVIIEEPTIPVETPVKKAQTIYFGDIAEQIPGSPNISLSAQASSGLSVDFSLDSASRGCELSSNTVKNVSEGICIIHAHQAGNDEYEPAPEVTQRFTIKPHIVKKEQTIQFDSIADQMAGDSDIFLSAQASSGLSVDFSLDSTSSGCELSANTVKNVSVGICIIHANQVGNDEYVSAPTVTQRFNITEKHVTQPSQTITLDILPNNNGIDSNCELMGNAINLNGIGTCTIQTKHIGQVSSHVNITLKEKPIVNQPMTFSLVSGSPDCSLDNNSITINTTGTCTIQNEQGSKVIGNTAFSLSESLKPYLPLSFNLKAETVVNSEICSSEEPKIIVAIESPVLQTFNVCSPTTIASDDLTIPVIPDSTNNTSTSLSSATLPTVVAQNGVADSVMSNHNQTTHNLTVTEKGSVSGGEMCGYTKNEGILSDITICKDGTVEGGILSGNIKNEGIAKNLEFTGNQFIGGTLQGEIASISLMQDVTLDKNTVLDGGEMAGTIKCLSSETSILKNVTTKACTEIIGCKLDNTTQREIDRNCAPTDIILKLGTEEKQPLIEEKVEKQEQTITFEEIPGKAFSDEPFELEATSDSGLPITFSLMPTSLGCELGSNVITVTNIGRCVVKAEQIGNETFAPAEVMQEFAINRASQTIIFSEVFDSDNQAISFEEKGISSQAYWLKATSTSGLPVTYNLAFESVNCDLGDMEGNYYITAEDRATCIIEANQVGSEHFEEAEAVTLVFFIIPENSICEEAGNFWHENKCLILPELENAGVDSTGRPIDSKAILKGGVSINGAAMQQQVTISLSDMPVDVLVAGNIQFDEEDIGKTVDMVVAATYSLAFPQKGIIYYDYNDGQIDVWDGNIANLDAYEAQYEITTENLHFSMPLFSATFEKKAYIAGKILISLGYRMFDDSFKFNNDLITIEIVK